MSPEDSNGSGSDPGRRQSLLQHFLGAMLVLLAMAFGIIFINAVTSVTRPREREIARAQVTRLHGLAGSQLHDAADPAAACRLVGAFFDHAAIVDAQRRIIVLCSGEIGFIGKVLERMKPPVGPAGEDELLEPRPFGGGHLHRMVPLVSAAGGEPRWFFVSAKLPAASWSDLLSGAAWSLLPFLLFAFLLVWWKTRVVSEDLKGLVILFESFRMGRLDARPNASPIREISRLQEGIGAFAEETEAALALLRRERNELDAVFSAMTEGVVVLDLAGRVSRMNPRAQEMFSVQAARIVGRLLIEVIRHADLEALLSGGALDTEPVRRDLQFEMPHPRILQVHCSRIRNAVGLPTGTLLVFEEVTLLRRLESVRREFSSNVSHELKTPITSIIGFVETLRDETSAATPEERSHYLEVISRQAARLHAIVEDLLKLSRIELITDPAAAGLEPVELTVVLEAAVGMCAKSALDRNIRLQIEPGPGLVAELNASLFEQALVNVIDNAIKYGPENSVVNIGMENTEDEVRIHVLDQGIGIPEKDIPHIFERFYRVDKGRSRKAGGTGLGLSIARHIMQVHRGRIIVESRLGEGSCFTLVLPRRPPEARDV